MKVMLMNQNTEVLIAEYNGILKGFTDIYEIKNIDYAPIIIKNLYDKTKENEDLLIALTKWFKCRGIPEFRDDLDLLIAKLNINDRDELLDKSFGLSLSDQYCIKEVNNNIEYKDINFFEHDFFDSEFTNVTFGDSNEFSTNISLISPNNTTDGRLKKTWIIENKTRYLLKGGYKNEVIQPFNEVLASMICKRLGFLHTNYEIEVISGKITSKCACFITKDTELVTAHQILHNNCNKNDAYEEYIKILENHNIKDARIKIENMILLDYIMMNEDRHLNNFGIIRDVGTLNWIDIAPIYDNGESLNILNYNDEEVTINGEGRLFYKSCNFEEFLKHIKDITRFDLSNLDGVVEEFDDLLHQYQHITNMSDERINKICTLLFSRINKLKRVIEEKKKASQI